MDHLEPTPDPVPFPTQTGPRMVGALPEPNGHPRPLPQPPSPESVVTHPVIVPQDAAAAIQNLDQLRLGAEAGLFETAAFFAEIIGGYQQKYQELTGRAIGFHEATGQVFTVISLITA